MTQVVKHITSVITVEHFQLYFIVNIDRIYREWSQLCVMCCKRANTADTERLLLA